MRFLLLQFPHLSIFIFSIFWQRGGRWVSYVYVLYCLDPLSHLAIDVSWCTKLMHTRTDFKLHTTIWHYFKKLVYLNGTDNAAEVANNVNYGNSYPMNWTVKNWFAQHIFESLWQEMNWNCYWVGCFVGLNRYCVQVTFSSPEFELNTRFASSNLTLK